MINRPSRQALALALRRYVAQRCTNFDLDNVAVDPRDRGANAIQERAWFLYDDIGRHRATGRHRLDREARRTIARWVLFLHSEQEYLWPDYSFIKFPPAILAILTLGWWWRREKRLWSEFVAVGDFQVWPFISKEAESLARARPVFLNRPV